MSTASPRSATPPAAPPSLAASARHRLLLRDTATFVILTAITVVLFSITLFLFRSFEAHQHHLAIEWSERGRAALEAKHPDEAVTALRTALTFAPGQRSYELLLAQALGDAGRTEESFNYFTSLWDAQPGDGMINLRLARLSATKGDADQAINFYRAALYGTWPGDAIARRQQTRFELSQYLIDQGRLPSARAELLILGSNIGRDAALETRVAGLLTKTGSPQDALAFYDKALSDDPHALDAAVEATRLSLSLGNFVVARTELERALRISESTPSQPAILAELRQMRSDIDHVLLLNPAVTLPSSERVRRILADASTARNRLSSCLVSAAQTTPTLAGLSAQWSSAGTSLLTRRTLLAQPELQDSAVDLVFNTEIATAATCGPPTGDDALLLRLAQQHATAVAAL